MFLPCPDDVAHAAPQTLPVPTSVRRAERTSRLVRLARRVVLRKEIREHDFVIVVESRLTQ